MLQVIGQGHVLFSIGIRPGLWNFQHPPFSFAHSASSFLVLLSVTKMLDRRLDHRDIRPPKVLWNPEIKNVVLVFKRSKILKQLPVLQETSPNRVLMDFASILASA